MNVVTLNLQIHYRVIIILSTITISIFITTANITINTIIADIILRMTAVVNIISTGAHHFDHNNNNKEKKQSHRHHEVIVMFIRTIISVITGSITIIITTTIIIIIIILGQRNTHELRHPTQLICLSHDCAVSPQGTVGTCSGVACV